jgi:hypothetical protein
MARKCTVRLRGAGPGRRQHCAVGGGTAAVQLWSVSPGLRAGPVPSGQECTVRPEWPDRQASTVPLVVQSLCRTTNYSFCHATDNITPGHRQYYSFGHRQNYSFGDGRRSLLSYRLMSASLACCCFFRRLAGVRSCSCC